MLFLRVIGRVVVVALDWIALERGCWASGSVDGAVTALLSSLNAGTSWTVDSPVVSGAFKGSSVDLSAG